MCDEAPAVTTWGAPVCQPCADTLNGLHGELQAMEAADPELAEAGRKVEEAAKALFEAGQRRAKERAEKVRRLRQ